MITMCYEHAKSITEGRSRLFREILTDILSPDCHYPIDKANCAVVHNEHIAALTHTCPLTSVYAQLYIAESTRAPTNQWDGHRCLEAYLQLGSDSSWWSSRQRQEKTPIVGHFNVTAVGWLSLELASTAWIGREVQCSCGIGKLLLCYSVGNKTSKNISIDRAVRVSGTECWDRTSKICILDFQRRQLLYLTWILQVGISLNLCLKGSVQCVCIMYRMEILFQ